MPLTDAQWKAFAAAHPQDDFQLNWPGDIEGLWEQVREFFQDHKDAPEIDDVCLWNTSDECQIDQLMTVDLPGGLRVASLLFTPGSLCTTTACHEIPKGSQVAREVIDSLLDMRDRLASQGRQHQNGSALRQSRSVLALAELCQSHGRAFRLTGDSATGTTELRVTWPTGHPSGLWSLHAEWAPGRSTTDPSRVRVHRRDLASGNRIDEAIRAEQAVDLITEGEAAPAARGLRPGAVKTVTVKSLFQALFEADQECLSPAVRVVIAHNGAPELGDPVTAIEVLPFRTDPDTGQGLLGMDADAHPDAEPALVLFTEH